MSTSQDIKSSHRNNVYFPISFLSQGEQGIKGKGMGGEKGQGDGNLIKSGKHHSTDLNVRAIGVTIT